ncbi:hypothetical protein ECZU43_05180 [Escherichia coli]|nr:hypothetical protein ECZU43_05180 [Escherichia coli]
MQQGDYGLWQLCQSIKCLMTAADPVAPHIECRKRGPAMNIRADTKRFFTGTGQQYYADLRISFQRVAMRQQLFEHLWG